MAAGRPSYQAASDAATDAKRMAALGRYAILDTPAEAEFDDIARLAAGVFDAPMAVVNLIADDRQWFKAEVGIGARELPLDVSICAHALLEKDLMVVADTRLDQRFAGNPLVAADDGLCFYAGALLKTPGGVPIGTVCVLDRAPRPQGITDLQRLTLEVLARQVMTQLELRLENGLAAQRARELEVEAVERRAAQTASSVSEQRYRTLFETLDAGFCTLDFRFDADGRPVDFRFADVNPAFAAQTGRGNPAGQLTRDAMPGLDAHWYEVCIRVALTGVAERFERPAQRTDDRWYDVHVFRVVTPGGQQIALLFNDVTARRRAEEAVRSLNATLNERVDQVVAEREATENALRQAQKMEAIGQLTGGVAHDFNNLLTVIIGSVELLRHPGLAAEKRLRYIDAIRTTAERGATLTKALLAFSRRTALKPEAFEVGANLVSLGGIIRTLAGSRVEVSIDIEADCHVVADRSQFETAVVNLAVNARDAMHAEGRLAIAARGVDALPPIRGHAGVAGRFVAISVSDTGEGIAAGDLTRIFEPFFTTKAVGAGTGLGLSQVFGFAKQSDGDVAVDSAPGAGASFTLYLPRAAAARSAVAAPRQTAPTPAPAEVCVLIVEDNAEVGAFAAQALAELGYDSRLATDGHAALAMLAEPGQHFHIVFSDVVMPGMGGIELAERVKLLHPGLPLILTSGYSKAIVDRGLPDTLMLPKPYSIDALSGVLMRATGRG